MKVKLKEVILAVPALSKLASANLSLHTAYALRKSMVELQKEADFFREQRDKYLEQFKVGASGKLGAEAETVMNELLDMEVEPKVDRVSLSLSEDVRLSVNDLESLAPFITFTEEKK